MRKASIYRNIVKSILTLSIILASSSVFAADPVKIYYRTAEDVTERLLTGTYISVIYCSQSFSAPVVEFSRFSGGTYGQWDYEVKVASSGITPSLSPGAYIETGSSIVFRTALVPNGVYIVPLEIVDPMGVIVRSITCEITKSESPIAVIEHIEPAAVVCEGTVVTLSAKEEAEYKYVWSKGGVDIKEGRNLTVSHDDPATGPGMYRLLVSRYGCEDHIDQIISFNPNPSVTVTPPMEVCPKGTILLKSSPTGGTSPYVYNWTTSALNSIDPSVAGNQNITIAPAEEDHEGQYTVTVTDANGCKAVGVSDVTVHPIINPGGISGTQRICEDSAPKELKSTAPASGGDGTIAYLWVQSTDGGSTWIDADGTNDELTYTPPSDLSTTTMYKRTVSNSCGTAETSPVTVTVDKKVVLSLGGPYSTCPEVEISLNGSISGGVSTGTWSVDPSLGSFDDPTKMNAKFTPAAGVKDTDIQLKLVSDKPAAPSVCQAVDDVVVVKVHDKGKATYSFPTTVCNSAPEFPLDITPAGGTYTPNTYNDVTNFKPSDFNNGDTYTFKYDGVLDANGCAIDEDITISITSPQVFNISASVTEYCFSGDGVSINLDGSESGLTYTVYKDGNPTSHTASGTGNSISIPGVKDGNGTYTIRATDANGCWIDMAGSVMLTEVSDIAGNDIAADQTICSGGPATLITGSTPTGGNGTFTYLWQKSEDGGPWIDIPGSDVKDYDPGNVSVTTKYRRIVTSGACTTPPSTEVTISVFSPIQNNKITATNPEICNGAVAGLIKGDDATSTGGPVSYIWQVSNDGTSYTTIAGATEKDYNALTSLTADTWYRRVATDGGTCPDDESAVVMIDVLDPLGVSATVDQEPSCGNSADGQLKATATGGKGSYTIFWTNNDDGSTYTGNPVTTATKGNYTVKVHEAGCATYASNIFKLNAPADVTGNADPTHITTCFGRQEGSIEIKNVTGGDGNYTYSVKDSAHLSPIGNVFANLYGGDYTIIITDGKGCRGTASATIDQPTKVEITNIIPNPPTCDGKDDGSITVNATGGTGAITYTLNGGAPTPVGTAITGLAAGKYDIVVTDTKGCFITGSETLADPAPVTLTATGIDVKGCPGSPTGGIALSITGGTGPYEYYSDQLGSMWTVVPTGNEINGLAAGTYTVKVRDANGCESAEQTVTVTESNALDFTLAANSVKCANSKDGEIVISDVKGGAGSGYKFTIAGAKTTNVHDGTVEYAWPDDFHGSKFENLEPDTYTLTLSDGVCNSLPKVVTIDAPPAITLTLDEVGKIYCSSTEKASIKFTVVSGGNGDLHYYFAGTSSETGPVDVGVQKTVQLGFGVYSLVVRDKENCESDVIEPIDITQGDIFDFLKIPTDDPSYIGDVSCSESADGYAQVEVKGGSGLYYYEAIPDGIPGATTIRIPTTEGTGTSDTKVKFDGLRKGEWVIMAYDLNEPTPHCPLQSEVFKIGGPEPVEIEKVEFEGIRCYGDDATFTVVAKGGNGEYIVTLFEEVLGYIEERTVVGSEPAVFKLNIDGNYYATVKDTKNCGNLTTSTHSVDNPAKVQFAATNAGNVTCAGGKNGIIRISSLTGGNGEYWYSLNDGESVKIDDPSVDKDVNVPADKWDIKVFDGNGCPADPLSYTIDITEPAPLKIEYKFDNPLCSTTGELKAILKGGSGSYQVSVDNSVWTDIVGNEYTFGSVSGGTYTLYVRDALDHDCSVPHDTTFETPKALQLDVPLTLEQSPSCQQIGRLVVKTSGGMATVQYKLYKEGVPLPVQENGTGIFEVKDGGDYYVEITDGCSTIQSPAGTDRVHIDQVPYVTINGVNIVEAIKCKGDFARIKVDATGGTGELYYALWNNSVNPAELIQENAAGDNIFTELKANPDYMIIVRDGYGCEDKTLFAVDEPEAMLEWSSKSSFKPSPPSGMGKTDGFIHFKVKGGEAPYTATFTPDGEPSQTVTLTDSTMVFMYDNLGANIYYVKVTDQRGCEIDSTVVLQPAKVKHTVKDVSCYGGSDGQIIVAITGTPPYVAYVRHKTDWSIVYRDYEILRPPLTGLDDTLIFSGLPAGEYRLYVGDIYSLSPVQYPAVILEPTELELRDYTIVKQPICATGGDGIVNVDVGGSRTYSSPLVDKPGTEPTYVVKWNNTTTGETGQEESKVEGVITVGGLNPGIIEFTVTTTRGCGANKTFTVDFPIIESIIVSTNVLQESSYDAGNGLIEANVTSGGVPDFEYVLHTVGGGSTAPSPIGLFSNVARGKYVVEARDVNGCSGLSDTIEIKGTNVVIDAITDATCFGHNNGAVRFHIEHGFPPFQVSMADAAGNPVAVEPESGGYLASKLLAGDYTITIVDSLGNTLPSYLIAIGQPDKLIISITAETTPACSGDAAGSIDFAVAGGVPDYSIVWSVDGQPEATLSGTHLDDINGGSYYFVAIDAAGCNSDTLWHVVAQPAAIALVSSVVENPICYGEPTGRIEVVAEGSTDFLYQLESQPAMPTGVFENLQAGSYTVTVQDLNSGCMQAFTFELQEASAININIDDSFTGVMDCPYDTDGYISLSVSGGAGDYRYIWPQLGESGSSVSGLAPGDYVVIVADNLNCTATQTITINGPAPFEFAPSVLKQADCRYSVNTLGGELHVSGTGGTAPYTYTLIDPSYHAVTAGAPNFTGLGAGVYEVVAIDANGCRYTKLDTVPINPKYDFEVGPMDTTVCFANEVTLDARLEHGALFDTDLGLNYEWWSEANAGNAAPDAGGMTYHVEDLEVNTYRFRLRVSMADEPKCYVEKWFEVGVYPKLDLHVPLYVSSVQNDTILSILFNQEYNVDVSAANFDYSATYEWKPQGVFTNESSWNSSIFMTAEKYEELRATYPERFVKLRDPQTKRESEFFKADVVATTDVGCKDSLTLYTKIVSKLYLANVFSPNGDGRNDLWRIPKEYLFPDLEIEIFNRWGALVWSAKGDKAARGWDGRSNNGKHLPIGTYWYVIKFNINSDDWKPLTGSVTIVK